MYKNYDLYIFCLNITHKIHTKIKAYSVSNVIILYLQNHSKQKYPNLAQLNITGFINHYCSDKLNMLFRYCLCYSDKTLKYNKMQQ